MKDLTQADSYGPLLKYWRKKSGINQALLALECDTSSRHLSCVETERAQPSRHLLLRLCSAMKVPVRARNSILISAGYAPLYQKTGLSDPEMAQARQLLETIVHASEPYPSMLLDGNMDIILHNKGFEWLVRQFAKVPDTINDEQPNLLLLLFRPTGLREHIVNLDYVYQTMVERARRSLLTGAPDQRLREVLKEVAQFEPRGDVIEDPHLAHVIMPIQLRKNGIEIALSTTSATLGSSLNITLQELFIETAYPLDAASTEAYLSLRDEIDESGPC